MTLKNIKILICDDSILARKKLKDFLALLGCTQVIEASDGQAAIDKYKNENPDIVFLDIVMPLKDGISAVKEIIAYDPAAYICMTSSVGTQENLKEALKSGASDFIQKPLNNDMIIKVIENKVKGGN
ncbi:MAG: response regulator [Lachnospiraceae bacterium]|nr:response regulator [Lachnospiraceae bacterium]